MSERSQRRIFGRLREALERARRVLFRRQYAPLFGACFDMGDHRRLFGPARGSVPYRLRRVKAGEHLEFWFRCPRSGFCGLGLPAGEPSGDVGLRLTLEIWGAGGRLPVEERRLEPTVDGWEDWHWCEIEPVRESLGARVRVRLLVEGPGQAIAVPEVRAARANLHRKRGCLTLEDTGARFERAAWRSSRPPGSGGAAGVRVSTGRQLRILTYRWHVAHQYELYKLPHRFVLAYDLPVAESRLCARWAYDERPKPPNAVFAPWSEIRLRDFDLLLLHFDENVLDWQNAGSILPEDWGATFRFFMSLEGLPKVAICHGTPQFRGMCEPSYSGPLFEELADSKRRLQRFIGDMPVVCNSHQARDRWGFSNSRVIWHGFDPEEFPLGSRHGGVVSLGRAFDSRPHYRGKHIFDAVVARLPQDLAPGTLQVAPPDDFPWDHGNAHAIARFRNYARALGEYSIYFNPTLNSPMPRMRGEAMMCGLATVSARNHDVDRFVDNERNGFYATDVDQLGDYLRFLGRHPEQARKVGERGRERAIQVFHVRRYLDEWKCLLSQLTA